MYEYPSYVHEIMEFCTETLIEWMAARRLRPGDRVSDQDVADELGISRALGNIVLADHGRTYKNRPLDPPAKESLPCEHQTRHNQDDKGCE